VRPATGLQIGPAGIVITERETRLKFAFRHLVNWLWSSCHWAYPSTSTVGGYCHA
jgi:hypothetical protein